MIRLRGYFDGRSIVFDDPPPTNLAPGTVVEVAILESRDQALRAWNSFLQEWWRRPLTTPAPMGRAWNREALYDRRELD